MRDQLLAMWPYLLVLLDVIVAVWASAHAVLRKRDSRSAAGWVGLIWLAPLAGALLYVWLGINRIERRAKSLRSDYRKSVSVTDNNDCTPQQLCEVLTPEHQHLRSLVKLNGELTHRPLLSGNRVVSLVNGDQAFPEMLAAIDSAERSITLCTYIFDDDRAGRMFLEALQRAVARGVAVRVLIDGIGACYSWPTMLRRLRRAGIPCARFMFGLIPWRFRFTNMRNHRKILVIDGRIGFTGGMNIREGNCLKWNPRHPIQDLHFRVTGPVVSQLQEVFVEDWAFSTEEFLEGEPWFAPIEADGPVLARGLPDGPDEHLDFFRLNLLGAIACARTSILVMTPYFLPDAALITALNVAAMRGVQVDIVLPRKGNLPLVQWASTALLWQVLERGCRVWLSPPPFDHTKLLVIDGIASFVGSANWDPRSLRLNFEFNLECYDLELAKTLTNLAQSRIEQSTPVTLADVDGRSLPIRLRDGIARLWTPLL
jgi:cardiolipin synthase